MIRPLLRHTVTWVLLSGLCVVEWLHEASWAWALAGLVAALLALGLALWRRALGPGLAGAAAVAAAGAVLLGSLGVHAVEARWTTVRERRFRAAFERLEGVLARALADARTLAAAGAEAAAMPQEPAFRHLARAVRRSRLEAGIVVYDPGGEPWAWSGRRRGTLAATGPADGVTLAAFYAALESRRQTGRRVAVASVLLDADSLVADRRGALASAFERATGARLRFYAPRQAPTRSDVIDFQLTDPASGAVLDTLFSVQLLPPRQGDAKLDLLRRWTARTVRLVLLTLAIVAVIGPTTTARLGALLVAAWLAARAPLGDPLFSPATFYRDLLGPFSSSAGALGALAAAGSVGAIVLWHYRPRIRWWSWLVAGVLIVGTPYVLRNLGRGIAPPAQGASVALWLTWELALTLVAAVLVLIALALLRGPDEPGRRPVWLHAGVLWATAAGVAGLWLWEPRGAWPGWYGFLWVPAVALLTVPARRRAVIWGTGVVAGTAAALITWGATVEGMLGLATRDVEGLGREGDALAVAVLERLGEQAQQSPTPRTAADLYHLWRSTVPGDGGYPVWLGLWGPDGRLEADLRLARVDASEDLVRTILAEGNGTPAQRIVPLARVPGIHYLSITPFAAGHVLTIVIGPRSQLVPPGPIGRFLSGRSGGSAPYTLALGFPVPGAAPSGRLDWKRDGWDAHGEALLDLPGGVRLVHATVDLGGAVPTLVRGGLVVLVDTAVLGLLWLLVAAVRGDFRRGVWPELRRRAYSYRLRVMLALAAFFILPTVGFVAWSVGRLAEEVRRGRDLLVRQTLRDVTPVATRVWGMEEPVQTRSLEDMARRVDAELLLYQGAELVGASAPVLSDLGLLDPLLPPAAYDALVRDGEVEATGDVAIAGRDTRVGYRVVPSGTPEAPAILAAPQWLEDTALRDEQRDLAFLLVLATLVGLAASVWLAGFAARQLARPVAALQGAAEAVGRGEPAPALPADPPAEFRPVMEAFRRMAEDVRAGRELLETARRRTARVLENVATGVVAVTRDLTVTLANPRAEQLLGGRLEPGTPLDGVDPAWRPVCEAVRAFVDEPEGEAAGRGDDGSPPVLEFEVAARRIRVQLARLGDGAVVAFDDATELARAARVLAWGEMARQVAHEIKNPLTPLRLGVQHLRRVYREQPEAFPATFEETSRRLLAEIVRLDTIARAFSRFGAPSEMTAAAPLEDVDLAVVAREVLELYGMGGDDVAYRLEGEPQPPVRARKDEVQEVMVNLLENARNAGAGTIRIAVARGTLRVADDGRGIALDALPRIFEPRFSTTTSGAGLGLAIVKRMVDSWGARVTVESEEGKGTSVTVRWD